MTADDDTHLPHLTLPLQGKVPPIATSAVAARVRGSKSPASGKEAKSAATHGDGPLETQKLLHSVCDVLEDMKAVDITVIPLKDMATFADFLVVTSGTSTRHVASIGQALEKTLGKHIRSVEGLREGEWVCADLSDIVVHIFVPEKRVLYNLEKLWSNVFPEPKA